ncbi:MAG TPA: hypothetical protein VM429_13100, partial [Micropruina sp.]|nr:hypothetical protein [Micropruina sp.]
LTTERPSRSWFAICPEKKYLSATFEGSRPTTVAGFVAGSEHPRLEPKYRPGGMVANIQVSRPILGEFGYTFASARGSCCAPR